MFDILNAASIIITGTGQAIVNALEDGPGGALKRKLLLAPGTAEAWDECHCGFFIQTNTRTYFSTTPLSGEPTSSAISCAVPFVNFEITATQLRCSSGIDKSGNPPTPTRILTEGLLDQTERYLTRQALLCHLNELMDDSPQRINEFSVGEQVGVGPLGGCVGSSITYSFALLNRCPCS